MHTHCDQVLGSLICIYAQNKFKILVLSPRCSFSWFHLIDTLFMGKFNNGQMEDITSEQLYAYIVKEYNDWIIITMYVFLNLLMRTQRYLIKIISLLKSKICFKCLIFQNSVLLDNTLESNTTADQGVCFIETGMWYKF